RPERTLRCGSLGGLGRVFRFGMDPREGKVAEDKSQLRAECPLHVLYDRVGPPTVRTLVVAVFDQCQGSIGRARSVVVRSHRRRQLGAIVTPAHGQLPTATPPAP